jgi:phasin family protein
MANPGAGPEWLFDMGKIMGDLRAPGVDMESVVAIQRKNMEALTQANQLAIEGAQAVLRYQLEVSRRAMEEFTSLLQGFLSPNGSMEDRVAKQAEVSKQAMEKGLSNARELTELMTKANTEAFNVISKRVAESLEEIRDYAKKRGTS